MLNKIINLKQLCTLILPCLIFYSCCHQDKAKLEITDFSKTRTVFVKPCDNDSYAMMNVWINGQTNDTILIKLGTEESLPILKLSGKIKERWYMDYYGGFDQTLIFDPYKATQGNLEIRFELN